MRVLAIILFSLCASGFGENIDPNFDAREFVSECQEITKLETFSAKFRNLIAGCFENKDGPFVVLVAAEIRYGRFHLTKVEDAGLFLGDEGIACLRKAVGGIYWPVWTRFKYTLGASVYAVKESNSSTVRLDAQPACHQIGNSLELKDRSPIADGFRLVGSPRDNDEVVKDLDSCESKLAPSLKDKRLLGLFTERMVYKENKSYLTGTALEMGDANAPYTECVKAALTQHVSRRINVIPKLVISGKPVDLNGQSAKNEQWFARIPQIYGKPLHYFWGRENR